MNFDEWLDANRSFALANYPSRKLVGVRLEFDAGKPVSLPVPDEQEIEYTEELHPVEQAIIDALAAAPDRKLDAKTLQLKVQGMTKTSRTNYYRFTRRLKAERIIAPVPDGCIQLRRNIGNTLS